LCGRRPPDRRALEASAHATQPLAGVPACAKPRLLSAAHHERLVNIDVHNLKAASALYQTALGLIPSRTLEGDVVELSGASITIYLLQKPGGLSGEFGQRRAAMRGTGRRSMISPLPPSVRLAPGRSGSRRALNGMTRAASLSPTPSVMASA
jgi:hypothetical protein